MVSRIGALLLTTSLLVVAGCHGSVESAKPSATDTSLARPDTHRSSSRFATTPSTSNPLSPLAPTERVPGSFADLAEAANPAVVSIKTRVENPGLGGRDIREARGSAFIYSSDGLVLTNHHVIADAVEIRVVINEQRELEATVVGRDEPTDIAVLKVDATGLPTLRLGDSERLRVGDWVIAIGNPFGLSRTVSAGIVSAKGRTGHDVQGVGDGTGYYDFIQTDAAINPGNSGGPLIDMSGRVVGINTAIRAEANRIGFAIPIDMVEALLPRLLENGSIKRSAIGAEVSPVSAEDIERLGLSGPSGAIVRNVIPGGGGEKAGLKPDDLITELEGHPIPGPERLRWEASLYGVGKVASMKVKRNKRELVLMVRLGELPGQ